MTGTSASKQRKVVATVLKKAIIFLIFPQDTRLIFSALVKSQSRGAEQSRIVSAFRRHDLNFRRRQRKCVLVDLMTHVLLKQFPPVGDATADYDRLRVKDIDQVREADAEIGTHATEDFARELVALFTCAVDFFGGQVFQAVQR